MRLERIIAWAAFSSAIPQLIVRCRQVHRSDPAAGADLRRLLVPRDGLPGGGREFHDGARAVRGLHPLQLHPIPHGESFNQVIHSSSNRSPSRRSSCCPIRLLSISLLSQSCHALLAEQQSLKTSACCPIRLLPTTVLSQSCHALLAERTSTSVPSTAAHKPSRRVVAGSGVPG